MATLILFDNSDNYRFLEKNFDAVVYSPNSKKKFFSWVKGVLLALKQSNEKDTIVCWFDFQAVLLFFFSKILFKSRKIICLNIMLKQKSTLKNKVVTILYKYALKSKNFKATVTSREYGFLLNKQFGKEYHYTLLRDVYHDYYESSFGKEEKVESSVFCGGRNGRDWDFLLRLAARMTDITFNVVVSKDVFCVLEKRASPNVSFFVDVPYEVFVRKMLQSKVVALPLKTEAPAGLIVLFQTIANELPFVVSRTATTQSYSFGQEDFFVANDVLSWEKRIRDILLSYDSYYKKVLLLKEMIKKRCNEDVFKSKIEELIYEKDFKSNYM